MRKKKSLGATKNTGNECMKLICISNYEDNFQDIYNIVYPHNKVYFDRHGIDYKVVKTSNKESISKKYWDKIFLVKQLLEEKTHDWIFLLDIDAIVVDQSIDIRNIISMSREKADILICHTNCDPRERYWNINIGSVIFKNNSYSLKIINEMIQQGKNTEFLSYEQPILQQMLRYNHHDILEHTEIFPAQAFNHEGKFIYHACDISSTHGNLKDQVKLKEEVLRNIIK
jgi:hypothetical protein